MNECSRCGQCCLWINLGRVQSATKDQRDYASARGAVEDKGFFLIPFKCPHLHQTYERFESDDPITYYCDIHDTKPKLCKEFDGKMYKNRVLYWVPDECKMSNKNKDSGVLSNKNWT